MALTATIYNLTIDLANIDRGVYEKLEVCIARQPSETVEYISALAACCEAMCSTRCIFQPVWRAFGTSFIELASQLARDAFGEWNRTFLSAILVSKVWNCVDARRNLRRGGAR